MPPRSRRMCSQAGCRVVVSGGKCAKHQAKADAARAARMAAMDAARPSSGERGYDADWRAVRRQFLAAHPMCLGYGRRAGSCGAKATEVDHIVSVAQAPELRLRWSNLRPFCKPCHSARTAAEQGMNAPPAGRVSTPTRTLIESATCTPGLQPPSAQSQPCGITAETPKGPPLQQPCG